MNYRHLYHAGNICDVVKHVTLFALLAALKQKPAPFMVLDTHAGCGRYDLTDPLAQKTGEAEAGIRRALRQPELLPEDFRAALAAENSPDDVLRYYPGSPLLVARALRLGDRYIGCELHPEDYAVLQRQMPRQSNIQLHCRDGYEALRAFTPPPEKRGLVLIDPPFEQPNEFERLATTVAAAYRRWANGIYALWYPLKNRQNQQDFHRLMAGSGIKKQLLLEFTYAQPVSGTLYGSGMLVINPPWILAESAQQTYANLHRALMPQAQSETKIAWLVGE